MVQIRPLLGLLIIGFYLNGWFLDGALFAVYSNADVAAFQLIRQRPTARSWPVPLVPDPGRYGYFCNLQCVWLKSVVIAGISFSGLDSLYNRQCGAARSMRKNNQSVFYAAATNQASHHAKFARAHSNALSYCLDCHIISPPLLICRRGF